MKKLLLAFALLMSCLPLQAQITNGLVSHWKMDGSVSGVWPDSMGSNPLFQSGQVNVVPAMFGGGASIDSLLALAYLSAPGAPFSIGQHDMTVAVWFKNISSDPSIYSGVMSVYDASQGVWPWSIVRNAGDSVQFQVGQSFIVGNALPPDWNCIVGTYSASGTMALYVNGALAGAAKVKGKNAPSPHPNSTLYFGITGINGSSWWDAGNMIFDSASFWSRVLTPSEIASVTAGISGLD